MNKISDDDIYIVSNASMVEQDFGLLSGAADNFSAHLNTVDTSLVAIQVYYIWALSIFWTPKR